MRALGFLACCVVLCAAGIEAAPLSVPLGDSGAFAHSWLDYGPLWYRIYLPPTENLLSPPATPPISSNNLTDSNRLLNAATADIHSVTFQPATDPGTGIFGPLLAVPEPDNFTLVTLPLLLIGGAVIYRRRIRIR